MYSIKSTPNYYQGTLGAPQESYLTWMDLADDPNGPFDVSNPYEIAEWETKEEAQFVIDDRQGDGPYHLSHGEAGRPTLKIIEDLDDGFDDCQEASGYEMYEFTEVGADNLPEDIQNELDALNVEHRSSSDDHDIYTATYTDKDGKRYAIAYCPTTIALQINSDDLGALNWEKAAYFVED